MAECSDHDKIIEHSTCLIHQKEMIGSLNKWREKMITEHALLMQQFGEKKGKVSAFFVMVVITALIALFSLIASIVAIVRHG